jgi:glycosyltransferase involved in cell wall biosynthesis
VNAQALVSVIVPVYQGEHLIAGAIRSVLAQTHEHLEVIVVDDGSTDETLQRLAKITDSRLCVVSQANGGTAKARNTALSLARGTYIAFLDSDDRWFPGKLEAEVRLLREASDVVGIAYSSYYAVDDRGRLLNRAPARAHAGNAFDLLLDGEDFLMPSVCLFDRRIFDQIGYFNPESYHEDHEFIMRALRTHPIFPTRERLVIYRQSTAGKCRSILCDFERARSEEMATLGFIGSSLSDDERDRFRDNLLRSLFFRFLMYGFDHHAKDLLEDISIVGLRRHGKKGWLAWLFAWTGMNLPRPRL